MKLKSQLLAYFHVLRPDRFDVTSGRLQSSRLFPRSLL